MRHELGLLLLLLCLFGLCLDGPEDDVVSVLEGCERGELGVLLLLCGEACDDLVVPLGDPGLACVWVPDAVVEEVAAEIAAPLALFKVVVVDGEGGLVALDGLVPVGRAGRARVVPASNVAAHKVVPAPRVGPFARLH